MISHGLFHVSLYVFDLAETFRVRNHGLSDTLNGQPDFSNGALSKGLVPLFTFLSRLVMRLQHS